MFQRLASVFCASIVCLLAFSDLVGLWSPRLVPWGAHLWIFSSILLCIAGLIAFFSLCYKARAPISVLTVVAFLTIPLWYLEDSRFVNHEATQQMSCIMKSFASSSDRGFLSTCFLGYPARQYLMSAFPSLLMGSSLFALNLGQILYLMCGVPLFVYGIWNYLGRQTRGELMGMVLMGALLHAYYVRVLLLIFEQSVVPFSLALALSGAVLAFIATHNMSWLALICLIIYHAVFAYSPAFALAALGILFLLVCALRGLCPPSRGWYFAGALSCVIAVVASLFLRQDLRIIPDSTLEHSDEPTIQAKLSLLGRIIVNPYRDYTVVEIIPALLIVGLVVSCLLSLRRSRPCSATRCRWTPYVVLTVVGWATATTVISVVAPGYARPPVEFAIHRAMLTLPVLFSCVPVMMHYSARYVWREQFLLAAAALVIWSTAIYKLDAWVKTRKPDQHYLLISKFKHYLKQGILEPEFHVVFQPDFMQPFLSLQSQLQYFIPNARYSFADIKCAVPMCTSEVSKVVIATSKEMEKGCLIDSEKAVLLDTFETAPLRQQMYLSLIDCPQVYEAEGLGIR